MWEKENDNENEMYDTPARLFFPTFPAVPTVVLVFCASRTKDLLVDRKINQHSARLTNEQRKKDSVGVDENGLEICKCLVGI